jgi:hypothetical protein
VEGPFADDRTSIFPPSCCRGCGRRGVGVAAAGRAEAWACELRARRCHLRAGFQHCKSFVEMCSVRCCPLWHPAHCPMGTVPRVLVRRTASPAHADFGGLSSGAAPVVVRLDVVSFPPRSFAPTVAGCRLGGYPVGRDLWGGKRGRDVRGQRQVFLNAGSRGIFDRCFSTPLHYPH